MDKANPAQVAISWPFYLQKTFSFATSVRWKLLFALLFSPLNPSTWMPWTPLSYTWICCPPVRSYPWVHYGWGLGLTNSTFEKDALIAWGLNILFLFLPRMQVWPPRQSSLLRQGAKTSCLCFSSLPDQANGEENGQANGQAHAKPSHRYA